MPRHPVASLYLDGLAGEDADRIAAVAGSIVASPRIVVGLAQGPLPSRLDPLLAALTCTLTEDAAPLRRESVRVENIETAFDHLREQVYDQPQAAVALANLLPQTSALGPFPGFAAEAAVYSMLLGGQGFDRWLKDERQSTPPAEVGSVLIEEDPKTVTIRLHRPGMHNAMDTPMREALNDALLAVAGDDRGPQIVLKGDGESFCSGGDLTEFGQATDYVAAYIVRLERGPWRALESVRDRVHARVHGATIGAGLELAALAGHVSADPATILSLPELSMGLVPGAGGTVSVVRRIGRWRAAWLMLSGARLDAATALEWGLVDEVDA